METTNSTEWKPEPMDPTGELEVRRPQPGEMCTCGKPAMKVWRNKDGIETPYCGIPGR